MTPPEQLNLRLETNLASQDKDAWELGRIKPSFGSVRNFVDSVGGISELDPNAIKKRNPMTTAWTS